MIDHMTRCLLNDFLYSINALVNGTWGDWSEYGECTKKCGSGEKSRSRQCDSPPPSHGGLDCDGSNEWVELTTCNTHACPGNRYKILNISLCKFILLLLKRSILTPDTYIQLMENGQTLVLGLTALCLVGQMGSNNGIEPVQANMVEHLVQENRPKKEFVIVESAAQVVIRKQNDQCQDYS